VYDGYDVRNRLQAANTIANATGGAISDVPVFISAYGMETSVGNEPRVQVWAFLFLLFFLFISVGFFSYRLVL